MERRIDRFYNTSTVIGKQGRTGLHRVRERYVRTGDEARRLLVSGIGNATAEKSAIALRQKEPPLYVVPDQDCLLCYLDILLDPDFSGANEAEPRAALLLLQSALELASKDMTQRQRTKLSRLVNGRADTKVFFNEFNSSTDVWDTSVGAGDALIACQWIRGAFERAPALVVLTDTVNEVMVLQSGSSSGGSAPPTSAMNCATFIDRYCPSEAQPKLLTVQAHLREVHDEAATAALLSPAGSATHGRDGNYCPHEPLSIVSVALRSGAYSSGPLQVPRHCVGEGLISVRRPTALTSAAGGANTQILVHGRTSLNRSIHGDIVVVKLLPRHQWRVPEGRRRLTAHGGGDEEAENNESVGGPDAMPTGEVVAILEERRRPYVATIPAEELTRGDGPVLAVPADSRIPKIRIRTHQLSQLVGNRLLVSIDTWPVDSHFPNGHYIRTIGPAGHTATEVEALLLEHGAAFPPFSAAALACLPEVLNPPIEPQAAEAVAAATKAGSRFGPLAHASWKESGWQVPPEEAAKRRDLRNQGLRVLSVDPPGCQDIDDAMHVRPLLNGEGAGGRLRRGRRRWEIGVHIADVTHFVAHGSALDAEARLRGTTVYLPHRRFDMLPVLLSADLCSLHGQRDRLAVSVLWEVEEIEEGEFELTYNEDGSKKAWFGGTVVHSVAAMTYEQADTLVKHGCLPSGPDAPPPPPAGQAGAPVSANIQPALAADLQVLVRFGRWLRRQRAAAGALDLSRDGGELKFKLDPALAEPMSVESKEDMEIHHTIEELMVLANSTVAEQIVRWRPTAALLRTHSAPSEERFAELRDTARAAHVDLATGSGAELQASLAKSTRPGSGKGGVAALLKSLATRAMSEAEYVCSGAPSENQKKGAGGQGPFHHYGLGVSCYTHFTSPIRRYADVVVHRLLLASLGIDTCHTSRDLSVPLSPSATDTKITYVLGEKASKPVRRQGPVPLPASLAPSILALGAHHRPVGEAGYGGSGAVQHTTNASGVTKFDKVGVVKEDKSSLRQFEDLDGDDLLDALLTVDTEPQQDFEDEHSLHEAGMSIEEPSPPPPIEIFDSGQLATLCQHLNDRHRAAKQISLECQMLFLKLYFMRQQAGEQVNAVGKELRVNGFIAYIPSYDLSAPVFMVDKSNTVQLDPTLLGLPSTQGDSPAAGFTSQLKCRALPGVSLALGAQRGDIPPDLLEVKKGANRLLSLTVGNAVRVRVTCEMDASAARLPQLKLQLVGIGWEEESSKQPLLAALSKSEVLLDAPVLGKSLMSDTQERKAAPSLNGQRDSSEAKHESNRDLYSVLETLAARAITAVIPSVTDRTTSHTSSRKSKEKTATPAKGVSKTNKGAPTSKGARISFGGFRTITTAQKSVFEEYSKDSGYGENRAGGWAELVNEEGQEGHAASSTQLQSSLQRWDAVRENAAQREASTRMMREAAKRRQYKKPNN